MGAAAELLAGHAAFEERARVAAQRDSFVRHLQRRYDSLAINGAIRVTLISEYTLLSMVEKGIVTLIVLGRKGPHGYRKVKIFSRPTSLYCATSCNRHGKQKSALVEPQCFPPLRLST